MITAALVTDSCVSGETLVATLNQSGRLNVTAIFATIDALVASGDASTNLILLDLQSASTPTLIRELTHSLPSESIVVFGVVEDAVHLGALAGSGVLGCVGRSSAVAEFIDVAEAAAHGDAACSKSIASVLFCAMTTDPSTAFPHSGGMSLLTAREAEIVERIADGWSNKQIARSMSLQLSTVKNHVHNIFRKLDIHRRVEVRDWIATDSSLEEPPQILLGVANSTSQD